MAHSILPPPPPSPPLPDSVDLSDSHSVFQIWVLTEAPVYSAQLSHFASHTHKRAGILLGWPCPCCAEPHAWQAWPALLLWHLPHCCFKYPPSHLESKQLNHANAWEMRRRMFPPHWEQSAKKVLRVLGFKQWGSFNITRYSFLVCTIFITQHSGLFLPWPSGLLLVCNVQLQLSNGFSFVDSHPFLLLSLNVLIFPFSFPSFVMWACIGLNSMDS